MNFRNVMRRFRQGDRGAAIIEFALIVPIFFLIVWGIINFSRAYQRMNALSASLREGGRMASTFPPGQLVAGTPQYNSVKLKIRDFSTAYGYRIDTALVTIDASTFRDVHVKVTNYPLFSDLKFLGLLQTIVVSRDAVFRLEGGS